MSKWHISLPMYDWPELRSHTDTFHRLLVESFSARGFSASAILDRSRDPHEIWRDDHLLMSQTCGLPLMDLMKGNISLIGTPAYDIECGAGAYYSVIVVRKEASAETLEDLKGSCFAYNEKGSQSGYAALMYTLASIETAAEHFTAAVQSGSHRHSIRAVASGKADFAAIDVVSWKLALRHEKAASDLRVLGVTQPTPGLPYITSYGSHADSKQLHLAVVDAMTALNEPTRDALLLMGFAKTNMCDYRVIKDRLDIIEQKFGATK